MDCWRSRSLRTALGAVVTGGLLLGGVAGAPGALAVEPGPGEPSGSLVEDAIADAAEFTGIPEGELEGMVDSDQVVVGPGGHVAFIDPVPAHVNSVGGKPVDYSGLAAQIPGTPRAGSRPGAPVTVFIDFDGAVVEKTSWNAAEDAQASYDLAGASAADAAFRQEVWARIAEDYAPFNVNVTTLDPGPDALFKASAEDTTYGSWLVVTDDYPAFAGQSGGIASYQGAGSAYYAPAFVFASALGGGDAAAVLAKDVAEAGSHEVGHNFGLDHDGFDIGDDGTFGAEDEYYSPPGGLWGPLMGAPYLSPLTQWSKGDYVRSSRHEDDLALITDRTAAKHQHVAWKRANGDYYNGPYCGDEPQQDGDEVVIAEDGVCGDEEVTAVFTRVDYADYAADDIANTPAAASALDNASGTFTKAGVIGRTGDVDVFKVTTAGGPLTARVTVAAVGANLDSKLTLTNAAGTVLAENAPVTTRVDEHTADGLGAEVSTTVPAGTYYLMVDGVGLGNPNDPAAITADGAEAYTDYGSLGNYTLSGTATAPAVPGTDHPSHPGDTDGDGLSDAVETGTYGTDPAKADTDGDGLGDGQEIQGVEIKERFKICGRKARTSKTVRTDPLRADTDADGLTDGQEVNGFTIDQKVKSQKGAFVIGLVHSNPTKKDTDRDGLKDRAEVTGKANKRWNKAKTDPSKCDTDKSGGSDGAEVKAKANPVDWHSTPRHPRP